METKDNTIIIFPNHKKRPEDRFPDYTGYINVQGVQYECGLWKKEGKKGLYIAGNVKQVSANEPWRNTNTPASPADQKQSFQPKRQDFVDSDPF